jgi:hypothetical protein
MSELRKLTRLGGDVRKIAALLQSKGRGRDTILAHITPREAALLKARGGRGSTNPDTGLLEFEDDAGNIEDYQGGQYSGDAPDQTYVFYDPTPMEQAAPVGATPAPAFAAPAPEATPTPVTSVPGMEFGIGQPTGAGDQPSVAAPAPAPGLAQRAAAATGLSQDQLGKALGIGLQGLSTGLLTRRAQREAQAGKQEISQLGAPYRAKAQELMAQAQAGQLSPVGQQAVEAARARLAQGAQARGGVGAAQMATQLEAFRQQLLQQQYDLGLKLSGVADQFALRAIQQGLTADQQVNQLLGQAMGNIGAIFAGTAQPQVPGGR